MMRVAGTTPDGALHAESGSYIPARLADGDASPMLQSILAGTPYHGTSIEMGSWYSVVCNPLRDGGDVFGMFCVGADNSTITSLKEELAANYVGANGSASVFFVHGPKKGQFLIEPTGISKRTESLWLPQVLDMAQTHEGQRERHGRGDGPGEWIHGGGLLPLLRALGLGAGDQRGLARPGEGKRRA